MPTIPLDEAQTRLPELFKDAVEGRDVVIANRDGTAVRLVPIDPYGQPRFGSARGMFTMGDDFEEPLEDFARYER